MLLLSFILHKFYWTESDKRRRRRRSHFLYREVTHNQKVWFPTWIVVESSSLWSSFIMMQVPRRVVRLAPETTSLFVCDIQKLFRPLIHNSETVIARRYHTALLWCDVMWSAPHYVDCPCSALQLHISMCLIPCYKATFTCSRLLMW